MKIYLSGQISGTELSYTRKRFGDVADTLHTLGTRLPILFVTGWGRLTHGRHTWRKILSPYSNARGSICLQGGKRVKEHE